MTTAREVIWSVVYYNGSTCDGPDGTQCSTQFSHDKKKHKPIEIYSFVDPICLECWALEPVLKKLSIEYGQYFTIRHLIGANFDTNNHHKINRKQTSPHIKNAGHCCGMSWDNQAFIEHPPSYFSASIAVKAAEMQGRSLGLKFFRKLREMLFLEKQDINDEKVLLECAETSGLDICEFKKDVASTGAVKALLCDLRLTKEMNVAVLPTLVFFNVNSSEEGLKVTGIYSYEVYVQILTDILGKQPEPQALPDLVDFMKKYKFVAADEISLVYNWDKAEVDREMKKLKLKQLVECVPVKYGMFWRYSRDAAKN